jgi:hypothetical protein
MFSVVHCGATARPLRSTSHHFCVEVCGKAVLTSQRLFHCRDGCGSFGDLSSRLTTLLLASRLGSISALPYTSMVVDTCACRTTLCWTPMGAPVASSRDR